MTRVVFSRDFGRDLAAQTTWCVEHDHERWAKDLMLDVIALAKLLERLPESGVLEDARGKKGLRRLVLRRVPFVAWYVLDGATVSVVRLLHARQRSELGRKKHRLRR